MTLEQTQRRRQAVSTIHDIVSAMRAIAAGRIQSAQRALTAARRYEEVVLRALAASLAKVAPPPPDREGRPTLLLVMTSEQPLCGAFNLGVVSVAERRWRELRQKGDVDLVVVGRRGVRQLAIRGIVPHRIEPAATSLNGLRDVVKRLAALVDERFAAGQLGDVRTIYNRHQSISEQVPSEERIIPLDLAMIRRSAPPPQIDYYRQLPERVLLAGLISQYAFISLYRVIADSFAAEQASRLIAMDGATRNTERMLESLLDLERRERQDQITRQVLDLIAARFASG